MTKEGKNVSERAATDHARSWIPHVIHGGKAARTNGTAATEAQAVRSSYGYNMASAAAVSQEAAKRAEGIRTELGGAVVRPRQGRALYHVAKRTFDIVFSAAVLVAFCWLFAIIAIAIKLDDPHGPVVFKQERVGKNGKTFTMHKFRSMVVDAEDRLDDLRELNEKTGPVFKITHDPRITRVGGFLRKTSLDEMLQFVDVLKGDMSIVGPRPALPNEVAAYTDYQHQRLQVKPGITCYWQTRRNRDTITFDEWVDLDLLYIKKASVWTDFRLIVQTVGVVLTAQGS
jgi:lipopolysaccharide/colanic/teichoic acid biosynthesis glycosyltransferase